MCGQSCVPRELQQFIGHYYIKASTEIYIYGELGGSSQVAKHFVEYFQKLRLTAGVRGCQPVFPRSGEYSIRIFISMGESGRTSP